MDRWFRAEKARPASADGAYFNKIWKGSSKLPAYAADGSQLYGEETVSSSRPKIMFSRKAGKGSAHMLIEDEPSKNPEARQSSPSVISRLMGIDTLPTLGSGHKWEPNSCCPKLASPSARGSNLRPIDQSSRFPGSDHKKFKNVFEDSKSSVYDRKKSPLVYKGKPLTERGIVSQKPLDGTCSLTDKQFQIFSDSCSEHGVFDSMPDQENVSLHERHVDVNNSGSLPNLVTMWKSSKSEMSKEGQTYCEVWPRKKEKNQPRNVIQIPRGDSTPLNSKPVVRDSALLPPKFTKKRRSQKQGACPLPTHIVVLKPRLEKVDCKENGISSSNYSGIYHKPEYGRTTNGQLVLEVQKCNKLPYEFGLEREKAQRLSESWKKTEVNPRNDIEPPMEFSSSGENELSQTKSMHRKREKLNVMETKPSSSGQYDESEISNDASLSSNESSVSRQGRRHLSKQWIISQRSQKIATQSPCTLGEMLALSERENPYKKHMESRSKGKHPLSKNDSSAGSKEGIMQKDIPNGSTRTFHQPDACWQTINHPHSKIEPGNDICLPAMSVGKENTCSCCKASGNSLPTWNIFSATKKQMSSSMNSHHRFCGPYSSDSDTAISDTVDMDSTDSNDVDRCLQVSAMPQIAGNGNTFSMKELSEEHISSTHSHEDSLCNSHLLDSELLADHKDTEQTSPVSVLDNLEDEASCLSPDCFQKVSADLHELRLQLRLLKSESESESTITTSTDELHLSNEEGVGSRVGCLLEPEVSLEFHTEEEERDFSYVLGILTDSGFQGVSMDMIFTLCYLPETPVDPCIFEKLEKVFDEPEVWSRDERKFLFDLTNSTLSEFLSPYIDLHPWVRSGNITGHISSRKVQSEEVWRLLVRRRTEFSKRGGAIFMDTDQVDVRSNIDFIGRDIEKMIRDELLEELISDLSSGR